MRYSSAIRVFCGDLAGDGEGTGELSRRCFFVVLAHVLQPRYKPDDVVIIAAVDVVVLLRHAIGDRSLAGLSLGVEGGGLIWAGIKCEGWPVGLVVGWHGY